MMRNCNYIDSGGGMVRCEFCGDVREKPYRRMCKTSTRSGPYRQTVGQSLKYIIRRRYMVPPCGSCNETAKAMDTLGVDGCRAGADSLAVELQRNAESRQWLKVLAAAFNCGHEFYKGLILDACDLTERLTET